MPINQTDYSVVAKLRAPPPHSWRWEIYRAERRSPIEQSSVYFDTMAAASRAGREALKQLLDKLHAKHLRWPAGEELPQQFGPGEEAVQLIALPDPLGSQKQVRGSMPANAC
jgi:hypothetical protein